MTKVLITAFEPYDSWTANSSWLTLIQLTHALPEQPEITTRLYPVDLAQVRERLTRDLAANYDIALHLGQASGATCLQLERLAINVGGAPNQDTDHLRPIVDGAPLAYQSSLPLGDWAQMLRETQVPAEVSYHAGTHLCNATFYLSCFLAEKLALKTQSALIHIPLETSQVAKSTPNLASLPAGLCAGALRLLLGEIARGV